MALPVAVELLEGTSFDPFKMALNVVVEAAGVDILSLLLLLHEIILVVNKTTAKNFI